MDLEVLENRIKLVWITPDAEKQIMYCARVSNPNNQKSEDSRLLKYCIKNQHWSIYEQSSFCIEINTSKAISAQILRHKSFSFQEFSARYSKVLEFEQYSARRQDNKNRQNSIDDFDDDTRTWFKDAQVKVQTLAKDLYEEALQKGIAKEQARFLLPVAHSTRLYMSGSVRSWITYLLVRLDKATQKEHRDIAKQIWLIFKKELPTIAEALEETYDVFK